MSGRPSRTSDLGPASYWTDSRRPLVILVFLLPLIILYELGMATSLRDAGVDVGAHHSLLRVFEVVGMAPTGGLYLGGLAIVVVLLVWHVLNRDHWKLQGSTLGLMCVESLVLTLPLLVLSRVISREFPLIVATSSVGLYDLNLVAKLTISVGAGLYEELLFRMLVIAVVHTLLVDALRATPAVGATIAILVSAVLFTIYHPLSTPAGDVSVARILFYMLAGCYFGALFVVRGFGIVVAVHACYDIITLTMSGGPSG